MVGCFHEFCEGPSPLRLEKRLPALPVEYLWQIQENFEYLISSKKSTSRRRRKNQSNYIANPQFLQLAPPYHHIPNTPYFRRAYIVPPPIVNTEGLSSLQRIINRYLLSMKIIGGYWKEAVSLLPCFSDSNIRGATINVEIRDLGTGDSGKVQLDYDPWASSFDIIPLQPFFNSESSEIPFVTVALGTVTYSEIEVNVTCISRKPAFKPYSITKTLGAYFEIPLEKGKSDCNVLLIEAKRVLSDGLKSRSKTLVIPFLRAASSYKPSWIQIQEPRGFYKVGEKVDVRINKGKVNVPRNYMVLCNSFDIISVGKIRDDNTLKIPVTANMLGECYIFVYSNKSPYTVDMMLFFVDEICEASTTSSKLELKPGHNVTFGMNGKPNSLVLLRAINDQLNFLKKNSEEKRYKSWDFGFFQSADPNHQQSRLRNFVDLKSIERETEKNCHKAGSLYSDMFGKCPIAKASNSMISDFCLKKMIEHCLNPVSNTKTTAYSCATSECAAKSRIENIKAASFLGARTANYMEQTEPIFDEPVLQPDDDGSPIRQRFHEVWLFDVVKLDDSGFMTTTVTAPDNIGRWAVASAYWAPGHPNLCNAKTIEIVSKKNYFLEVDIPRHAYSNESVSVKVSVTALQPQTEKKLSICMSDLSRKICADVGANGRTGESIYSRVIVSPNAPIVTKTFTMKFLGDGVMNILFQLREQKEYPGKKHCDIGQVYDSVRIKTKVSRRVEAEEMYKVLIVDPDKPLHKNDFPRTTVCKDERMYNYYNLPLDNPVISKSIEISECRGADGALHTEVFTNVLDADVVQIFTVDIHRFLPNKEKYSFAQRRVKRNHVDVRRLSLNEVLIRLSVELYHFKSLRTEENTKPETIERSEKKIGSLISEMLLFSDCHVGDSMCGFSEYEEPTQESQRDPLLTAISASLICQGAINNEKACGPVKFIENLLLENRRLEDIDISHLIDLDNPIDRRWFLISMFLQVLEDCLALQCPRNQSAWSKLFFDFDNLDDNFNFDDRTLAALAFLSPKGITELMRIKMMGRRKNAIPFWSAGKDNIKILSHRMSTFDKHSAVRKLRTGDVLANSLGILSFIVPAAESEQLNWDSLASWLYEQQQEDGGFRGVLDTFYATRAIYEYRYRKVNENSEMQLKVVCENGPSYEVNVTSTASEFYFPTNVRNFTIITRGHGKLRVGIHMLASKKQRSRRGLTQDNYYPVRFSIDQEVIANGVLKQTVCFTIRSAIMTDLEITHGIYTGYSLKPSNVVLHQNSSFASFRTYPSVSSYAAHFVLQGLKSTIPTCYEVGLAEPNYHHEPLYLAPVALQAKHVFEGLVGMALITHPDQLPRFRRGSQPIIVRSMNSLKRSRRDIINDSVDTVCFKGGTCACAETTCSVNCGLCELDTTEDLEEILKDEDKYVALGEAVHKYEITSGDDVYTVIRLEIKFKTGYREHLLSNFLNVWIRKCSYYKCVPDNDIKKSKFYVIGDVEGISVDSDAE
ncbi:unnamed protein product [Auanema sp. JU1783]|nr:unnamed protein product [Auanema sp. JU1783]